MAHLVSAPLFSLIAATAGRVIVTSAVQNTTVGDVVVRVAAAPVDTFEKRPDCAAVAVMRRAKVPVATRRRRPHANIVNKTSL